jgi:hypothetical protein
MKVGDLVVPVTKEWDKKRYTVLDIFVSERNGDRLIQVGFIGSMQQPQIAIVNERLFERSELNETVPSPV